METSDPAIRQRNASLSQRNPRGAIGQDNVRFERREICMAGGGLYCLGCNGDDSKLLSFAQHRRVGSIFRCGARFVGCAHSPCLSRSRLVFQPQGAPLPVAQRTWNHFDCGSLLWVAVPLGNRGHALGHARIVTLCCWVGVGRFFSLWRTPRFYSGVCAQRRCSASSHCRRYPNVGVRRS